MGHAPGEGDKRQPDDRQRDRTDEKGKRRRMASHTGGERDIEGDRHGRRDDRDGQGHRLDHAEIALEAGNLGALAGYSDIGHDLCLLIAFVYPCESLAGCPSSARNSWVVTCRQYPLMVASVRPCRSSLNVAQASVTIVTR